MATKMPLGDGVSPSRDEQSPSRPKASFRTLPPELRLMIWEAACIPFAKKDGVHYIDIDMIEEDNENEGSLYTRDMGLWNACRESRDAIAAHYHLDLFRLAQTEPLDSIEMQCAIQPTHETNTRLIVSVILRDPRFENGQNSDNYFFIVVFGPSNEGVESTYHRLCIWTTSPESLIARIERLNLYLPKVKGPREIELVRGWNLALPIDFGARTWQALAADMSQQGLFIIRDMMIGRDLPFTLFDTSGIALQHIMRRRRRRGFFEILTRRAFWNSLGLWVSIWMLGLLGLILQHFLQEGAWQ